MSRKHKKVFTTLNYIEHFLILASAVTGCISIATFASFLTISIWFTSSAVELKIWSILSSNSPLFQIIVPFPLPLINLWIFYPPFLIWTPRLFIFQISFGRYFRVTDCSICKTLNVFSIFRLSPPLSYVELDHSCRK